MVEFLRFELKYRFGHVSVYLFALVFATMGFLVTTSDAVSIGGGTGLTNIDSPYVVMQLLTAFSVMAVLVVTAFTASTVTRDYERNSYSLFFTAPVRKHQLVLGRFAGGTLASLFVVFGASLGMIVGRFMPWLDPERLSGLRLDAHLQALLVIVLPNLVIMGAVFFAVATLTRKMLYAYVAVAAFFVIYGVSQAFIGDLDNQTLVALADPFAMSPFELGTRYWTPAERNHLLLPLSGPVILNRVVWLAVASAGVALVLWRFHLAAPSVKETNRKPSAPAAGSRTDVAIPRVGLRFDRWRAIELCWSQTRTELKGIVRSTPFIVLALLAAVNIFGTAHGTAEQMFGTPVYPVTRLMLTAIEGALALFLLIVITFYAGELIWRDRRLGLGDVVDALPIPNWALLVSKQLALLAAVVLLCAVGMLTALTIQAVRGYFEFELGLYAKGLFGLQLSQWAFLCVLALFVQVAANHRFIGYGLMVVYFVLAMSLPALGLEHDLWNFGQVPREPYSDMNGYGHFLHATTWFRVYWALVCGLLLLLANLFWIRGTDHGLRTRIRRARARITRRNTALLAMTTLAWLATGGYIYYNTNVLNTWHSSDQQELLLQRYEQQFGQYRDLAQPRIVATELAVDLFPATRRVEIRGHHRLRNKSATTIETLHVRIDPELRVDKLVLPKAERTVHDEALGYSIYRLARPLPPGAEFDVDFELAFHEPGFKQRGSRAAIVENGTFVHNSSLVPAFGYDPHRELSAPHKRRELGLPERPRMPDLDDPDARHDTYLSHQADFIDFAVTVSTSPDQVALAPGYLKKTWTETGADGTRRYFRYEMDTPILDLWAVMSARYEVARDDWRGIPIEIYYHPPHDYNVERMIESVQKSLDYYTENFGPYQHRQVRIVEFPGYSRYAQSLPNIIPYSESIGFIADLRDPDDIDYVFYVTAHEVAHQWWAHQVIGADAQGSTIMSETLAQYSALMVMEQQYGRPYMRKFLEYELDKYLRGRALESHRELPLLRVENQPYIHYRKGSLAMYALREYIGESAVNQALSRYLEQNALQGPPYTTSRDFIAHLRAVTPAKYGYLIDDLFETITIYDNRTHQVHARQRSDGRWELELVVESHKFRADEHGAEREVDMNDWIEIGALTRDEHGQLVVTAREKRRLEAGVTKLNLVVDERPDRAGIDPSILLIDRNPDDNTKPVTVNRE